MRLDTQTGEAQSWMVGPRCFTEELVFVPGPNGDTVEDDGWLLGMVFDGEANRSALLVCYVLKQISMRAESTPATLWLAKDGYLGYAGS